MKILLCDDDLIMLTAIKTKLSEEGYSVSIAKDGKQALEEIDTGQYDLIITDMHMPHATGMEIVDYVKNEKELTTPIIVLTKDQLDDTMEDAYELGADEYLNKPIKPHILSIKVKQLLKK